MRISPLFLAASAVALSSTACDREPETLEGTRQPITTPAPASPAENEGEERGQMNQQRQGQQEQDNQERQPVRGTESIVAREIAEARCAREMRCNNVGEGREYASPPACLTQVQQQWQSELSARECPGSINQTNFAQCLQQIRETGCDSSLESLGNISACRQNQICQAAR